MREIDADVLTELESGRLIQFNLIKMTIDSVAYRYTDCDAVVYLNKIYCAEAPTWDSTHDDTEWETGYEWGEYITSEDEGAAYVSRGFIARPVRYGLKTIVDQTSVEIDNTDLIFSPVFVGGTPQGSDVELKRIVLNSDYRVIAESLTLFQGEIGQWGLDENKLIYTAVNIFSSWNQKTLMRQSSSCRWKVFKGTECQYAGGESWCDRSYARCEALSNPDNFGGFRWLPSIMDKDIWFGAKEFVGSPPIKVKF